ncbi:MAG: hypothetical protein CVV16_03310 [Gammaproteobacteria bacterium HGW-Gammaproteobacteria-6]|nr:MAG: hypothetical protein CVV16_03310 [Gammaproteobacteria bacterium HGW-Gammaproteobacteria-6]
MRLIAKHDHQYRINVALISLIIGCVILALLSMLLPAAQTPGEINISAVLLDRASSLYPFTLQNVMWLIFFVGLGELWVRFLRASAEQRQQEVGLLPEDETTMLRAKDLAPIYRSIQQQPTARFFSLPRLIQRVILQFQTSSSVSQANALMNSSLELMQHEIDLRYNMLRYIMWLIPTLGFIGTVIGIALALSDAANMPNLQDSDAVAAWVVTLTGSLGLAFNTTLMALLMSAVLVFMMHICQGREEMVLNNAGQYCLDNLINRLYEE